jgi:hypothetical protein
MIKRFKDYILEYKIDYSIDKEIIESVKITKDEHYSTSYPYMRFSDFELDKIQSFLEKNKLSFHLYRHFISVTNINTPIITIYKLEDDYYDVYFKGDQPLYYRCDQLSDLLETIGDNIKITESVKITKD